MNLSPNVKKSISKILVEGGVKRAALFGSFARGDATEDSDIDLLIEFKGKKKIRFGAWGHNTRPNLQFDLQFLMYYYSKDMIIPSSSIFNFCCAFLRDSLFTRIP
jgi:hypothetical protein